MITHLQQTKGNRQLFGSIRENLPAQNYMQLVQLWGIPTELMDDETWVSKVKNLLSLAPSQHQQVQTGRGLYVHWRKLVGWESDDEDDDTEDQVESDSEMHHEEYNAPQWKGVQALEDLFNEEEDNYFHPDDDKIIVNPKQSMEAPIRRVSPS